MMKIGKTGKWIVAVVCCAAIGLSSGCGGKKEQDPMELYKAAVEKNAELEDLDMSLGTNMKMKVGEDSTDIKMDMDVLMTGYRSQDMKYQADTTMGLMGQSFDMTMYYTDGYYYMELNGQKIKYPYALDQIVELTEKSRNSAVEAEAIKELKAEKEGENTRLNFQADPEKMTEYTKDLFGNMQGSMQAWQADYEFTISEVSGSYLINPDGYYIESTVNMTMQMDVSGQKVDVNAEVIGKVNKPGEKVEVKLPEDLSSYTEVTEDLMTE